MRLLLSAGAVRAQTAPADWSNAEARAAASDAADQIAASYPDADLAARIAAALRTQAARGGFDGAETGDAFAARLLAAMRAVYDDRHFSVDFHPRGAPASEPPLEQADAAAPSADAVAWGRFVNGGVARAERLAGNIGYFSIRGMPEAAGGLERALAAISFLSETDALIVDLRDCGGGDPAMAAAYQSALTDGAALTYARIDWRSGAPSRRLQTPAIAAERVYAPDKPLFVLIGPGAISACEELAFTLGERGRATLVGETSAGAANPGRYVKVGDRFSLFLPSGRYVSSFSGGNWEGAGVAPDLSTPVERALDAAHQLALQSVQSRPSRARFRRVIEREIREANLGP